MFQKLTVEELTCLQTYQTQQQGFNITDGFINLSIATRFRNKIFLNTLQVLLPLHKTVV